ncbi:MAG: crossover junction endodeoxyribonuclease RuvC [Magnetococcales bacterium]|nr:crossover junction endodeoxyribonuclease RuvC [Magnetococcales bacterium]
MRVIGIDPGTVVTGWGIVEFRDRQFVHIANGCVRTKAQTSLPDRLGTIFKTLSQVILDYQPTTASVEEVFVSRNVQSALKLGHARGVAIAALSQAGIPVHEYSALQVKKSIVGYGRAEKNQVQAMVKMLLSLSKTAPEDASDALAAALCHINHAPRLQLIKGTER